MQDVPIHCGSIVGHSMSTLFYAWQLFQRTYSKWVNPVKNTENAGMSIKKYVKNRGFKQQWEPVHSFACAMIFPGVIQTRNLNIASIIIKNTKTPSLFVCFAAWVVKYEAKSIKHHWTMLINLHKSSHWHHVNQTSTSNSAEETGYSLSHNTEWTLRMTIKSRHEARYIFRWHIYWIRWYFVAYLLCT